MNRTSTYEPRGVVLPADLRHRLAALVAQDGDIDVAERFHMTRLTLARATAGFPVHRGTCALIREQLRVAA